MDPENPLPYVSDALDLNGTPYQVASIDQSDLQWPVALLQFTDQWVRQQGGGVIGMASGIAGTQKLPTLAVLFWVPFPSLSLTPALPKGVELLEY